MTRSTIKGGRHESTGLDDRHRSRRWRNSSKARRTLNKNLPEPMRGIWSKYDAVRDARKNRQGRRGSSQKSCGNAVQVAAEIALGRTKTAAGLRYRRPDLPCIELKLQVVRLLLRPSAKASRICVSRTTSALGAGGAAAAVAPVFKLFIPLITRNNTNAIMMKLTATVMKFP